MSLPAHGSNTKYVYEALQIEQPENVIDFSVNLNPLGVPVALRDEWQNWLSDINDYPDPHANDLIEQLSKMENIPKSHIMAGNGASEIITLIARHLAGQKVMVIHPAFSEYETACRNEGCEIVQVILSSPNWELDMKKVEDELEEVTAVFLCNPNNPTGVHYDKKAVEALVEACKKTNTICIIDEAFYDFLPEPVTFIHEVLDSEHVLIIRSLTKMYSIAGLRLGFLAGNPVLLKEIKKRQPHWSVNALAMKAGVLCLRETNHVAKTVKFIYKERTAVFSKLKQLGFEHSSSKLNFYLLRDPKSHNQQELFHFLLKQGLVLRHTNNFPGIEEEWLRVAVRKSFENNLLMEALATWKREN